MSLIPFPSTSTVNANTFVGGDPNSVTNPVFVSGAFGATDAANRMIISAPYVLGDYRATRNNLGVVNTEKMDSTTTDGNQAVTYNAANNTQELTTSNVGGGGVAVLQSIVTHPYFAGQPQVVEFTVAAFEQQTDIEKFAGYFSYNAAPGTSGTKDGIYIRVDSVGYYLSIFHNGTVELDVEQASWNTDTLDGSGPNATNPSGATWAPGDYNTYRFEFIQLGSNILRFFIYVAGEKLLVHEYSGKTNQKGWCESANQPFTIAIEDPDGITNGKVDFHNAYVASSNDISKYSSQDRAIHKSLATAKVFPTIANGTIMPLLGIRLKASPVINRNACVHLVQYSASNQSLNALYTVLLMRNPVFVGDAAVWSDYSTRAILEVGKANENAIGSSVTEDQEKVIAAYAGGGSNGDRLKTPVRLSFKADYSADWDEYWVCVQVKESRGYYDAALHFTELL